MLWELEKREYGNGGTCCVVKLIDEVVILKHAVLWG